ncbi:SDR family oxidoreductase [Sphingomonas sp. S2-65]|uniref:SDR family oxidoreductase n=1 Tax=Sphingomonas sp. S2-65 TaxID=2903960 RepID=UPI001F1BA9E3|nr:SDR family oxidoreductase [Sphingomonas sp. S2-65]UYY58077.1 SDR family oxidoreductase [Sphingomonas sp. S2-65]
MIIGLENARVLVVGGSSGIGRATAEAFARSGASVTVASRGGETLTEAAAAIQGRPAPLDTGDNEAIERFFAEEAPFDHVVVSAAKTKGGPVGKLPIADAQASMESKFWGAYRIARASRIVDGGSLTFVSGFLSHRPSPTSVLQGAINAAIEALGRGLALERAPVRVNTVSPGLIDTPLYAGMSDPDRAAMFDRAAARLPVGRIGNPEDVAAAILLLATNPFATGTTLTVDGGASIA